MRASKTIKVENLYYMLAYAFKALRTGDYARITPERFSNAEDMLGWIIGLGMSRVVRQGLCREYVGVTEDAATLRGRINVRGTLVHRAAHRPLLTIEHDEFTEDNLLNQILKTAAILLYRSGRLDVSKKLLKSMLPFFDRVSSIMPCTICWSRLRFQKSNQHYHMLMNICRLVIDGMLMSQHGGTVRVANFDLDDEKLWELYEAFVREYFARHYNLPTRVRKIQWDIDDDEDRTYLPEMQADVVLERAGRVLIIDTKCYGMVLRGRVGGKISNDHLYQLLSYVNNYKGNCPAANVSGMLLYAKTIADDFTSTAWTIGHNRIDVRTLDLGQKFSDIARSLDSIVSEYFGDIPRRD